MSTATISRECCAQCAVGLNADDRQLILHGWQFCSERCQRTWLQKKMKQREISKFIATFKGK